MFDLHIHTTHSSDGQHSPYEILRMAQQRSLTGLAFTDHMDVTAVPVGMDLSGDFGLQFFPGVEISSMAHAREYHLLCYGFTPGDTLLTGFLEEHCAALWDKVHEVLDIFVRMGFAIEENDVDGWGRSVPTGVTFLNALKKRNASDGRLHDYFFGNKASSPYLNFYQDFALTDIGMLLRSRLPDLTETMRLIRGRGLLVLAHPGDAHRDFLAGLKHEGLDGIEAHSSHHTHEITGYLLDTARSLGLLVSAGSDFHGELIKPGIGLGDMSGSSDDALIRGLMERRP
jgi:3',5'-nucleoside bisphosphate phosphatase